MRDKKEHTKHGAHSGHISIMKEEILKAWNCGARSFDEVVEITGYKEKQVAKYLPKVGRF